MYGIESSYNYILIIVNQLTKMINNKSMKITINTLGLPKVIIDVMVKHHGLLNSIMSDKASLFTSKFGSSQSILGIKHKLFTLFFLLTNVQTKRQNSTMQANF